MRPSSQTRTLGSWAAPVGGGSTAAAAAGVGGAGGGTASAEAEAVAVPIELNARVAAPTAGGRVEKARELPNGEMTSREVQSSGAGNGGCPSDGLGGLVRTVEFERPRPRSVSRHCGNTKTIFAISPAANAFPHHGAASSGGTRRRRRRRLVAVSAVGRRQLTPDVDISRLVLGTMFCDLPTRAQPGAPDPARDPRAREALGLLALAADLGVTSLDTAEMYPVPQASSLFPGGACHLRTSRSSAIPPGHRGLDDAPDHASARPNRP